MRSSICLMFHGCQLCVPCKTTQAGRCRRWTGVDSERSRDDGVSYTSHWSLVDEPHFPHTAKWTTNPASAAQPSLPLLSGRQEGPAICYVKLGGLGGFQSGLCSHYVSNTAKADTRERRASGGSIVRMEEYWSVWFSACLLGWWAMQTDCSVVDC